MKTSRWKRVSRSILLFFIATITLFSPNLVFALDDNLLDMYAENNILFYDPTEGVDCDPDANLLAGNDNLEKIWNYIVKANISGVSTDTAVISGLLGNFKREQTEFDPFVYYGSYYGIFQTNFSGLKTAVEKAVGSSNYWHEEGTQGTASQDDIDKALEAELDFLIKNDKLDGRFSKFTEIVNKEKKNIGVSGADAAAAWADLAEIIIEIAIGGKDTIENSVIASYATSEHYQDASTGREYAREIYKQYGGNSGGSQSSSTATKNFDAIYSAKNANKQYDDEDIMSPVTWSDNNTEKMKTLLEDFGDLAYQLGRAVGAPYVAILVQMRYEDPGSICGRNNFWGNGCPPGTPAGGASIQGKNLGEGFAQYGETLLNGSHDQAIGITDAKEYLEKLGPTWVQGNINGAGYGQIDAMKKSVDALQAYIDTDEGQAIVKTFGSYSDDPCPPESTVGEAAKIPLEDRMDWLFPDGVPTSESEMKKYLTTIDVPIVNPSGKEDTLSLTVHKKLATEYAAVFNDLLKLKFPIDSGTYVYSYRVMASGTGSLSHHSYGVACDVNPSHNDAVYKTGYYKPGTDPLSVTDEVIKIWKNHGFYWGGDWSASFKDPMHFTYTDH